MEDYEKKYKEALERARKLHNEAIENDYITEIEDFFLASDLLLFS